MKTKARIALISVCVLFFLSSCGIFGPGKKEGAIYIKIKGYITDISDNAPIYNAGVTIFDHYGGVMRVSLAFAKSNKDGFYEAITHSPPNNPCQESTLEIEILHAEHEPILITFNNENHLRCSEEVQRFDFKMIPLKKGWDEPGFLTILQWGHKSPGGSTGQRNH